MAKVTSPDGLPVVQPTRERVNDLLAATERPSDHEIGEIPPHYQKVTVEKVAVNAVMAGCAPECFPIVLAALEATLDEKFNLYGALATTHPCWPSVIVNGPIVEEAGINGGANAYGQGTRSNATIGRSLTFIYMNLGGAITGTGDKATHGGPHKFGLCVAENEPNNPWEPLHVERGYDENSSTVTVVAAEAPHNINEHIATTATGILTTVADAMAIIGTNLAYLNERGEPHVVFSPEHADSIASDGWSKRDVKRFLYDNARIPMERLRNHGMWDENGGGWPPIYRDLESHQTVPLASNPDKFLITVTGGAGKHSLFHPSFGDTESVTVPILS